MLVRARGTLEQTLVIGLLMTLAALAWAATLALPGTPLASVLSHAHGGGLDQSAQAPALGGVALFLVGWTVMTAAMMLPTALPMVATFARVAQTRPRAARRVLLFVLGYLTAWAGFGGLAYAADLLVHHAVDASPFLASHTSLIGGGALVLAGLYQLTPLKRRCLRQCRSALGFLMAYWREGPLAAWQMGAHHGLFCVGCCWALMLVMFGLGMLQLAWMLGLALLMFVEKVVRGGERIAQLASPVFVLLGLLAAGGAGSWS
jgi:predicted metal-binding membrane protein